MTRPSFLRRLGRWMLQAPRHRHAALNRSPGRKPVVEPLEDRVVPDAGLASAAVRSYANLINDPTAPAILNSVLDQAFDSSSNRYVLAEKADNATGYVPFLARFTPDGAVDTAFGSDGLALFASHSRGFALAIDGSDNTYVALDRDPALSLSSGLSILKLDTSGHQVLPEYKETRSFATNGGPPLPDLATDAFGFVYYTTHSYT